MLEVFYAGALRVSEVISLKLEDLKLEMGYVLVRGKGDKERIVPMGQGAQVLYRNTLATPGQCWRQGSRLLICLLPAAQSRSLAKEFGSW